MKKYVFILLLIFAFVTGCDSKKDNYKHYSFMDYDINSYVYYNDRTEETYALADITPDKYESVLTGFFYKVGENDYILLETLESSHEDAYKVNSVYQFYNNKLYGVGNGNTPGVFEIALNGKNSKLKKLEFKMGDNFIGPAQIIGKVENNYISFYGYTSLENEPVANRYFKCSLNDYQCEIIEKP